MTGVPPPRTEGDGVLGFVAESLRRLEDSVARGFAEVNTSLSRLPNDYIPRQELQKELDRLTVGLGQEEMERRADIAELRRQREEDQRRRTSDRRWLIGTSLATVGTATGVLAGIVTHFH